mmetsp:Transcript_47350/g.42449  ORF Transcript_47350/g.42449 Transcript_47350/m.42449 type:complete len:84 (-) Transcript_47350:78-329(-)|eukprot:CAMPEP_0201580838 /NCGR_PEP_ID=MMETSP0190_2-20130828/57213_1 /ASSEMBLY_ACC=CAM_ASM_000263 /TAXON_ID=37353 /ORGANISM="Rosalina sp." /LENGTH=83 /DNA_ID=CAMNT_0048017695 /DNA_START=111 /DNA_END=362 /DNA_ORIENTATION=+
MSQGSGKSLANPKPVRGFSNWLDQKVGWTGGYKEESKARGFVHGVWHTGAGIFTANSNEFSRAKQQFQRGWTSQEPQDEMSQD